MKICPRCLSTYSDETLNFCLSDGTPLVEEEIYNLIKSQEYTTSGKEDTISSSHAHQTKPYSSKPTLQLELRQTIRLKWVFLSVGILLATSFVLLGIWYLPDKKTAITPVPTPKSTIFLKKTAPDLNEEIIQNIKQEVTKTLLEWARTNSNKDLEAHLAKYADVLEVYYSESNRDKNHVRADRLRAYRKYDSISIEVENIEILVDSEDSVTTIFDKSWTMKGAERISTGAVQQEMKLKRTANKWLICAERDIKVYYINNRDLTIPTQEKMNSTATS